MTNASASTVGSIFFLAVAAGIVAFGFFSDPLVLRWTHAELIASFAWAASPGLLLATLVFSRWWPAAAVLVIVAGLAISFGPAAMAAGALVIIASVALGGLFLPRDPARPLESALLAGVLGLGLLATLISWSARAPVHFDFVYMLALGTVIVVRRKACAEFLDDVRAVSVGVMGEKGLVANRLVGSLLIALFLYAAGSGAIPEGGYDAMTIHYALLHELKAHGVWNYDPTELRFTLMPKLAVWAHAPFFVLGGEIAMRAVNLLAMTAIGALVAARVTPALPRWQAGILAASVVSLPLAVWLVTMMSEDPVATLFYTASAVAFLRMWDRIEESRWLYAGLALLGMAVAAKAQLLFGGGLGVAFVLVRLVRRPGLGSLFVVTGASLVFLSLAAFPYFQALALTGNPFYPFDPGQTVDARWSGKLTWTLPYDFVFHTGEHLESHPGAVGLFPILGLAAFGSAMLLARVSAVRVLGIVTILFIAGVVVQSQYVRYLIYVLPIMALCIGLSLPHASRVTRRAVLATLAVVIASNLVLMRSTLAPAMTLEALVWPERSPAVPAERRLYAALNATGAPVRVFVAGQNPYVAGLDGRADATGWYGERLLADRLEAVRTIEDFLGLARDAGVTHVSAVGGFVNPIVERICHRVCEPALQVGDLTDQLYLLRYPADTVTGLVGLKYGPLGDGSAAVESRFLGDGWSNELYPGARSQSATADLRLPRNIAGAGVQTIVLDVSMVNAIAWRPNAPPQFEIAIDGEIVDRFEVKHPSLNSLSVQFGGEAESELLRRVIRLPQSAGEGVQLTISLLASGDGAPDPRNNGDQPVGFLLRYVVLESGPDPT